MKVKILRVYELAGDTWVDFECEGKSHTDVMRKGEKVEDTVRRHLEEHRKGRERAEELKSYEGKEIEV